MASLYSKLINSTNRNTPKFNINGWYYTKVLKVYDGDTFTAGFAIDGKVVKKSTRMYGYNSQELHGGTERTREQGQLCKQALHDMIYGKIVVMNILDFDKYGRLLVDVYVPKNREIPQNIIENDNPQEYKETNKLLYVNDWMVNNTTSVEYIL
jgi:endonuclease YncB( thermonuclease family)